MKSLWKSLQQQQAKSKSYCMLTLPVALPFIRNETQLKMLRLAANPIQLDWIMTIPILLIQSKHYLAITAHVL